MEYVWNVSSFSMNNNKYSDVVQIFFFFFISCKNTYWPHHKNMIDLIFSNLFLYAEEKVTLINKIHLFHSALTNVINNMYTTFEFNNVLVNI